MFTKHSENGFTLLLPGIEQKTVAWGERTSMSKILLKKGSALPLHQHPHEQTGYLVSGRMRLSIAGRTYEVAPGDAWCIPADVEHGAEVLEDSLAIEVFVPVRMEYLPK